MRHLPLWWSSPCAPCSSDLRLAAWPGASEASCGPCTLLPCLMLMCGAEDSEHLLLSAAGFKLIVANGLVRSRSVEHNSATWQSRQDVLHALSTKEIRQHEYAVLPWKLGYSCSPILG